MTTNHETEGIENRSEFSDQQGHDDIKSETDLRVSKDAGNKHNNLKQEYAETIAVRAVQIAEDDGRETVRKEDIRQAKKELERIGEI